MTHKSKLIKLGNVRIKYHTFGKTTFIHINIGRYKKGKTVDTWTLYDGIAEKHKKWDDIWADYQDRKLIGVEIHLRD